MFNARLFLDGVLLGIVDAWWPEAGVAVEIDSREWHLLPAHWEATMRRHARLTAAGIAVIHVSPRQIRTEPDRIVRDIADALRQGPAGRGHRDAADGGLTVASPQRREPAASRARSVASPQCREPASGARS